jgi:hypothetical protein
MPPQPDRKEFPMSLVVRSESCPAARRPASAPLARLFLALVALLTLGAGGLSACDDEGEGMVVDAGSDGGGLPACKVTECASMAMPMHVCMNGSKASYVCARGPGGRCVWDQPVCSAEPGDGGGSEAGDGPNSEVGDGGRDDDALDASAD